MKKIYFLVSFLLVAASLQAQKKVTLEKVRCFSNLGPIMTYWTSPEVKKTFLSDLQNILFRKQGMVLTNENDVNLEMLTGNSPMQEKPAFTNTDSSICHLYIDLFELSPAGFLSYSGLGTSLSGIDSTLAKRAKTYFVARCSAFSADKKVLFSDELMMVITNSETAGIGLAYENFNGYSILATTPKGFTGILSKSMERLFDSTNQSRLLELKAPAVYMADNYLIPITGKLSKIFVQTKNNVSKYIYRGKTELVRMGDPMYEEIIFKGKKKQVLPDEIMEAIITSPNHEASEFVFLRQDGRDVGRDKNYVLKLAVQINPYFMGSGPKTVFTDFLNMPVHHLLRDMDTLATFIIKKNVPSEDNRMIYLNIVSNGADTASFFPISPKESFWAMRYNYTVTGKIAKQSFSIYLGGSHNTLKEFYLNGKMVCVAEGEFNPDKLVIIDPSLDPELLNQLFIIGFSRFFE